MQYFQAVSYINNLEKIGIRFGLARVRKILACFDNPQDKLKIIHVAGTNGKGSVCAFVATILQEAGFKVGHYTSPHLVDLRERIQIKIPQIGQKKVTPARRTAMGGGDYTDGENDYIAKQDFTRITERLIIVSRKLKIHLTYFEFLTVLAFLYFTQEKVDWVILEVGMGGRLDATNVIKKSWVTVITNIDFDHTQYLGNSLVEIAREKAAIIKIRGIVVTAARQKEVLRVIRNECKKKKAVWRYIDKNIKLPTSWKLGLEGDYQRENAACALGAVRALQYQNVRVPEKAIQEGLAKTFWPGRLEVFRLVTGDKRLPVRRRFSGGVTVLLDGAHNPAGCKALVEFLQSQRLKFKKLVLVFGVLKDKDYPKMIARLYKVTSNVILTQPQSSRALNIKTLNRIWKKYLLQENIYMAQKIKDALKKVYDIATNKDLICITGSLYTVGEAREQLIVDRKTNKK